MRVKWGIKKQIHLLLAAIFAIIVIIEATILVGYISSRRAAIEQELETIAKQVNNNAEIFFDDIESAIDNLYKSSQMQMFFIEDDPVQRYEISQYVQDIMNTTIYGNLSISSIRLFEDNYRISVTGSNNQHDIFLQSNRKYHFFDLAPTRSSYSDVYWDGTSGTPYVAYIRPVYPVVKSANGLTESDKRVFYALCRLDRIQQYLSSVSSSIPGLIISISSDEMQILTNGQDTQRFADQSENEVKQISVQQRVDRVNWNIAVSLPLAGVYSGIFSSLKENLIITVLAFSTLWLLGMWISRKLSNPVMKLAKDITYLDIENNTLPGRYGLQEIDVVAGYIDNMLQRIQTANLNLLDAQDRLHQSMMLKKEAELAFYQTQINPHFLYNTLECMRSIGQAYNVEEIQIMSEAMASIFRYSIKSKGIVSLIEEMNSAKNYCQIVSIRYLNKFMVIFQIDEKFNACMVPKMVFQPLIENAIGHGLSNKNEGGLVLVTATQYGHKLLLAVSDDGVGIAADKLENLQHDITSINVNHGSGRKGIALNNICHRIKIDFGEDYGLYIDSAEGFGTTVTMIFPLDI